MRDGLAGQRHVPTSGQQELENGPLVCGKSRRRNPHLLGKAIQVRISSAEVAVISTSQPIFDRSGTAIRGSNPIWGGGGL